MNSPRTRLALLLVTLLSVAAAAQTQPAVPREMEALKARYEVDSQAALKPVKTRYEQQLQALMRSLTTKGDLAGALAVKNEIDSLKLAVSRNPVGYWRFGNGAAIEIKDDGSVATSKDETAARWSWSNSAKGELRIRWSDHTDDLTLSEDGEKFTGKSSTNSPLSVVRITKREFSK
jgi:hypothetical protein